MPPKVKAKAKAKAVAGPLQRLRAENAQLRRDGRHMHAVAGHMVAATQRLLAEQQQLLARAVARPKLLARRACETAAARAAMGTGLALPHVRLVAGMQAARAAVNTAMDVAPDAAWRGGGLDIARMAADAGANAAAREMFPEATPRMRLVLLPLGPGGIDLVTDVVRAGALLGVPMVPIVAPAGAPPQAVAVEAVRRRGAGGLHMSVVVQPVTPAVIALR